ncbi:MAG TPA: hypothetical protein VIH96_18955 [Paraburkholderia sp.]|jgi:hypothetical protein
MRFALAERNSQRLSERGEVFEINGLVRIPLPGASDRRLAMLRRAVINNPSADVGFGWGSREKARRSEAIELMRYAPRAPQCGGKSPTSGNMSGV